MSASAERIGLGYDVHAFAEARPFILGGVTIDYPYGLMGHSDADVLCHAIMDSLLSAARLGDIGKLFPDTDPQYKDASSLQLLGEVGSFIKSKGWIIIDIDTVIACQVPKLSPYRESMIENITRTLGIARENLGVKATTTEKLGFVGRQEGVEVWSVCLLRQEGK